MSQELKNSTFLAIKGRFKAPNLRNFGQMFILMNQKAAYIEIASVVVGTSTEMWELAPKESWKKFEKLINQRKYENKYAQVITQELQETFKTLSIDKNFYNDLIRNVYASKRDNINFIFQNIFRKVMKDEEFRLEIEFEGVSEEDLAANEAASGSETVAPENQGPDGLYLPIKLLLDPVAGRNVTELKTGDKLMVGIVPDSERANYFIDLMQLRLENGKLKPALFEISQINYVGTNLEIIGKLDEGVFGKVVEEEKILVRLYDPKRDKPKESSEKAPVKKSSAPKPKAESIEISPKTLVLAGGGVMILLVALLAYMISKM